MTRFANARGHIWMARRFGLRAWFAYNRARRAGVIIDYSRIFDERELEELETLGIAPWLKADARDERP